MIPLPELGLELLMGVGAALLVGNAAALFRPRIARWRGEKAHPVPSRRRAVGMMLIGLVVSVWALATLMVRS